MKPRWLSFSVCVLAGLGCSEERVRFPADAVVDAGSEDREILDAEHPDVADLPDAGEDAGAAADVRPGYCEDPPAGYTLVRRGISVRGSDESESGSQPNERPQHEIQLTYDFWMKTTEVTQAEWSEITQLDPWPESCLRCPITSRYFSALTFANLLSEACGLPACYPSTREEQRTTSVRLDCAGFRLPSEAEWESAARGGSTSSFWTGTATTPATQPCDPHLDDIGWYRCNTSSLRWAGIQRPNPFGLFDLHGNAAEWVTDGPVAYEATGSPLVDPLGPTIELEPMRVVRGGSYLSRFADCRSAARRLENPEFGDSDIGFRLVRAVPR